MKRSINSQDISWFLDLEKRGLLDLSPSYQRRSVWAPKERRFFLDTIFRGYPSPPVFLHKTMSDDGIATYHVVDGKQRLESIINFSNNKFVLSTEISDPELKGKKFRHLSLDQKKQFWNYPIAVELLDSVDTATVKEIFERYNKTSKNLEPQELRHAKYDGWFVSEAEREAGDSVWRDLGVITTGMIRRMRDVQFLSELMMVVLSRELIGFDQEAIDKVYADYEVPSETHPDFSPEEFLADFQRVKAWIMRVDEVNQVVSNHAKSATHFYPLWSVAALEYDQLLPTEEAATELESFLQEVRTALQDGELDDGQDGNATEYARNALGASTEHPQRKARYDCLKTVLLRRAGGTERAI